MVNLHAQASELRKCVLCPSMLTGGNITKEHIIPNSIGGRRKTTGFICNTCNNNFGKAWDSELSKQLNWFSLMTGITRERGETPSQVIQTIEGDRYWLSNEGTFLPEKPSYSEVDMGDKVTVTMTSLSMKDAKKRLNGISRKYPKFDKQKALDELEVKTSFLSTPLEVKLSLGGDEVGHSLVKTAFAFASDCGVDPSQCEKAKSYLLDQGTGEPPFGFTYLSDLVVNRPSGYVFHCVSLRADPKTKRIYSYIEYFSLFRIVVLLGENYDGPLLNECYSINPVDGSGANVQVKEIDERDFLKILGGDGFHEENHRAAAEITFSIIMERSSDRIMKNIIREAFEYAVNKTGIKKGENVPLDKREEFTSYLMEKISPYIENLVRRGRPVDDY